MAVLQTDDHGYIHFLISVNEFRSTILQLGDLQQPLSSLCQSKPVDNITKVQFKVHATLFD